MEHESRLFACAWCSKLVCICKEHDRGQRYCSDACRKEGQAEQHRQANRKYNRTQRGREINKRRKRRARQKGKAIRRVTDHGGKAAECVAKSPASMVAPGPNSTPGCHFCRQIPRTPAAWFERETETLMSAMLRAARNLLWRHRGGRDRSSDAANLVQEATAKLLEKIDEPIVFDRMLGLCLGFVRNVARNLLRKIDRRQARTMALDHARELALV